MVIEIWIFCSLYSSVFTVSYLNLVSSLSGLLPKLEFNYTLNMQFHTKARNINSKFALSHVGTVRIIGILIRIFVGYCTHTFLRRFLYITGKASILKKFGRDNVFQETAEVFEDETAIAEEIKEAWFEIDSTQVEC